jgi:hypothetical protein
VRSPLSILVIAGVVALAGCGGTTIDSKKTASLIQQAIAQNVGAKVKNVSCPSGQDAKKGHKFDCTVNGPDGSKAKVTVTGHDDKGGVLIDVDREILNTRGTAQSIAQALSQKIKGNVQVKCQDVVQKAKGGKFTCTATDPQGRHNKVDVTQTDTNGNVFYKVL